MWIRTQDRETLINCDSIRISYSFCKTDEYYVLLKTYGQRAYKKINKMLGDKADKKIYHIETMNSYHILGYYDTQERCLEVLDEIERHINGEYKLIVKEKEKVIEQTFDKLSQSFLPPTESIQVITMPKVYQMPKE